MPMMSLVCLARDVPEHRNNRVQWCTQQRMVHDTSMLYIAPSLSLPLSLSFSSRCALNHYRRLAEVEVGSANMQTLVTDKRPLFSSRLAFSLFLLFPSLSFPIQPSLFFSSSLPLRDIAENSRCKSASLLHLQLQRLISIVASLLSPDTRPAICSIDKESIRQPSSLSVFSLSHSLSLSRPRPRSLVLLSPGADLLPLRARVCTPPPLLASRIPSQPVPASPSQSSLARALAHPFLLFFCLLFLPFFILARNINIFPPSIVYSSFL
ncbi:hypothetical protein EDD21DRAFT_230068 [Dissophora ornata]|nr:hypothetical protein EDD21DRAFT_230068 [Dissophora ornata]